MANLDRKAIDTQRALANLPPLTDAEWASLSGNGHSDAEKKAIEDKKKEEEEAARKKAESDKNNPPEVKKPTDEEMFAMISEQTGRTIKSWEDLKPKEAEVDEETRRQERESDKISWGLKNKKFKTKELENFITDSKDNVALVKRLRHQQALKENPNITEEEFEAEFADEFGMESGPETRRHKNGQAAINRIAKDILSESYGHILNLENEYSAYERQQQATRQREQKIKEGAKAYSDTLEKIRGDLKKMKFQMPDAEEYEVEILDESINNALSMMSESSWAAQQILKGFTYENLKEVAFTMVVKDNLPLIADQMATQKFRRQAAGSKGIIRQQHQRTAEEVELSPQAQVLKGLIDEDKQKNQPAATS